MGTNVYFSPGYFGTNDLGVFDTVRNLFSTVASNGYTKGYYGAAAVGNTVYFVPNEYLKVGVLNVESKAFTEIDTSSDIQDSKYAGAVAVGKKVYMTPYEQETVGVLDTATQKFSTIATTGLNTGFTSGRNYAVWRCMLIDPIVIKRGHKWLELSDCN